MVHRQRSQNEGCRPGVKNPAGLSKKHKKHKTGQETAQPLPSAVPFPLPDLRIDEIRPHLPMIKRNKDMRFRV